MNVNPKTLTTPVIILLLATPFLLKCSGTSAYVTLGIAILLALTQCATRRGAWITLMILFSTITYGALFDISVKRLSSLNCVMKFPNSSSHPMTTHLERMRGRAKCVTQLGANSSRIDYISLSKLDIRP